MDLTHENVNEVFMDCLFKDGENTDDAIMVEGIVNNFGLHPKRVQLHSDEIAEMLSFLPDEFKKGGGGGMSFLNACNNSAGEQWTSLHQNMEQLFVLGMATEKVSCLLPRDVWSALPSSMPYYVIL